MPDDHELEGLDPFDLLDQEASRLDSFFSGLDDIGWGRTSRCAGWTVRDVLGHLASAEEYHHACLNHQVPELLTRFAERGATDLDSANALGVADYSDVPTGDVLARWREAGATNRQEFRGRGDGTIDSSVGEYPCRWQAFHVAAELATHADDIGVPETDDKRQARLAWRARFSRFALSETKPDLAILVEHGKTIVTDGTVTVEVTDRELVDGVMGRLSESDTISGEARALLSTMP